MTSVASIIAQSRVLLEPQSPTAQLDVELLLSRVLKKNRTWLKTWPDTELSVSQRAAFDALLRRRLKGEPIAYILGEQAFWSFILICSPATLIPRPETELLVETILELKANEDTLSLLDMGTGTGAIALALASEKPQWTITACDRSPEALKVAQANVERLKLAVELIESDWFGAFDEQRFDVVVSNPPYIEANDPHLKEGDVRFEPVSALAAGDDGLADIRQIAQHALTFLNPTGLLLLEHGYDQGEAVRYLLEGHGYHDIKTLKDLSGHDRITLGYKKP